MPVFLTFLAFLGLFSLPAHASDIGVLPSKIGPSARILIQTALKTPAEDLEISAADLNGDSIDEYLVKKDCDSTTSLCQFSILGETRSGMADLGEISALRLGIGNRSAYGIKDIIAYKNRDNDYEHGIYRWEPSLSRYTLAGRP